MVISPQGRQLFVPQHYTKDYAVCLGVPTPNCQLMC